MALDVHLSLCYEIMMMNPSGCFTTASGNAVSSGDAQRKLDHMAQELGELIDFENGALTKLLKQSKKH